jgi:predicted metal-dependent HD superfamily phosphohydrolase
MSTHLIDEMSRRWKQFLSVTQLHGDKQVLERLLSAYTGPDRHYHNLAHIHHCLSEHESVRSLCPDPNTVEAAIWFHDVVYDPPSPVNEEKSADVADQTLAKMGMAPPQIALVHELILDTKHLTRPRTLAGQFMVDIDISSMGQSYERFDSDGRNIRIEYHHVDDDTFNRNRAVLFERLLSRPTIYYTDPFRERYEAKARQNISKSLERLKSRTA